jgi:hypothetical protein
MRRWRRLGACPGEGVWPSCGSIFQLPRFVASACCGPMRCEQACGMCAAACGSPTAPQPTTFHSSAHMFVETTRLRCVQNARAWPRASKRAKKSAQSVQCGSSCQHLRDACPAMRPNPAGSGKVAMDASMLPSSFDSIALSCFAPMLVPCLFIGLVPAPCLSTHPFCHAITHVAARMLLCQPACRCAAASLCLLHCWLPA